ncbi:serine/threonine-protein phosphatase 7 long form homolog [Amaranthus tricolor]|uniref:serine/threonine-protein phosphatase 7 long form homolog n=1 Tax=Amaranthus tricolor TaxID=29722 RepID=UPI002586CFAA|nr:serine/threonine-protein phosphatase 7 long form homolog [Amaranthus tricolor]
MLLQIWSWEHIHIGRPIIWTIRPDGQHDQEDNADDFEPVLSSQHRRGMDPLAVSWLCVYLSRFHSPHTLVYYRDALDRQRDEQITWQPYTAAKMDALPHICTSGHEILRSCFPLICFDIIELHLPDRVMRQFGLEQVILQACDTQPQLHVIDWRTGDKNYVVRHRLHVDAWNDRASTLVRGDNFTGHSSGM